MGSVGAVSVAQPDSGHLGRWGYKEVREQNRDNFLGNLMVKQEKER